MLSFLPTGQLAPPAWIPGDVSSYMTVSIDLKNAFDHCAALFDDLYADGIEGTFEGFLEDLRAEDGPQVDLERDLVAYLGTRVTMLGQYAAPDSEAGEEGNMVALAANDERRVSSAIERLFRDDPGATRIRLPGQPFDLWKVGEDSDQLPEQEGPTFSSSGVAVARGHLIIATDFRFIRQLLADESGTRPMAQTAAFQHADRKLSELGGEGLWLKTFSHLDRDLHRNYELLRLGRKEEARSITAAFLFRLLAAAMGSRSGSFNVDFAKMPKFDQVKHHLGTSAVIGRNHPSGWLLEGLILPPRGSSNE
jgi:hypothetical protein